MKRFFFSHHFRNVAYTTFYSSLPKKPTGAKKRYVNLMKNLKKCKKKIVHLFICTQQIL